MPVIPGKLLIEGAFYVSQTLNTNWLQLSPTTLSVHTDEWSAKSFSLPLIKINISDI